MATANTVTPRKGDRRAALLDPGYADLIAAAEPEGTRQFVLVSIPDTPGRAASEESRFKQLNEQRLIASSVPHTILRFPMFTEVWLALSGSSIPERGEPRSPLPRPYAFTRRFRRLTGHLVEERGRLLVTGTPDRPQAFISVQDGRGGPAGEARPPGVADERPTTPSARSPGVTIEGLVLLLPPPGPVGVARSEVVATVSTGPSTPPLGGHDGPGHSPWPGGRLKEPSREECRNGVLLSPTSSVVPGDRPCVRVQF